MKQDDGRRSLAVLAPMGDVFVNGLASAYEEEYPLDQNASFAQYMTQQEFEKAINKINDALIDHWPCMPCTSFAYGCCICTCGLSFYCASTQVREAEERVQMQIRRINEQTCFQSRQITWKLVRIWYKRTSYIEISIAQDALFPFPFKSSENINNSNHSINSAPVVETIDRHVV